MSETTLTQDVVRHLRDLAEQADSCGHGLHVTPQQMLALCDAAARAETLEAQLTEVTRELERWSKCDSLVCPYEQRALAAEAALAPLRAVVTAAKAFMLKWPDAEKAINGAIVIATVHSCPYVGPSLEDALHALRRALSALPADPSAPTPR